MKTIVLKSVFILFTAFILFTSCSDNDDDVNLTESEIPTEIKNYINTHFASNSIVRAEKDLENNTTTYDVYLTGDISLEFDAAFNITDIDANSQLPNSVIPQTILAYVTTNYPTNFITDWELEMTNQQVELNNNVELEFTLEGEFIRVDND